MKTCKYCGKEFTQATSGHRLYCSDDCAKASAKERFKVYWENNKEKHRKVCREYQLEHREERDRRRREFYERHPEKIKEYQENQIRKRQEARRNKERNN